MQKENAMFTAMEQIAVKKLGQVTEEELKKAKEQVFDPLPYPAFKLDDVDKKELTRILPELDISFVEDSELKCKSGACPKCGRKMNILDVVAKAVNTSSHSAEFLKQAFSGKLGRMVVSSSFVSDDVKKRLPANTMYVNETAPIACFNCGNEQDVVLMQSFVLHHWRL